jgi:hypothetical protein
MNAILLFQTIIVKVYVQKIVIENGWRVRVKIIFVGLRSLSLFLLLLAAPAAAAAVSSSGGEDGYL